MDFKITRFGDFAVFKYGKMPKKSEIKENGKYPIYSGYRYVGYYDDYNTEANQLIIVARGVGGTGDVKLTKERCYLTNLSISAQIDESVALPQYLYYYFSLRNLRYLDSGSAQSQITISDLEKVEIPHPNIESQMRIVDCLSMLDYKIRTNEMINNNLLDQALTLYATYFAESDKNGFIGDYCTIKSGFAFKSSWWTENGVKVIKIGSINQDNLNLAECSYVDVDKIDKAKDFKVGAGDLLIAMTGATIGKFAMVPYCTETLLVNQRVGKFFLGDNPVEKLPFIYCTLKQPDVYYEIVNRGQGSAQPNISAADIMSIPCVIPTADVLNTFNDTVQPLFDLIITNQQESQRLSELRDTLLPKLMSGELDVSDIQF